MLATGQNKVSQFDVDFLCSVLILAVFDSVITKLG